MADFEAPAIQRCLEAIGDGVDVDTAARGQDIPSLELLAVIMWMKEGPLANQSKSRAVGVENGNGYVSHVIALFKAKSL